MRNVVWSAAHRVLDVQRGASTIVQQPFYERRVSIPRGGVESRSTAVMRQIYKELGRCEPKPNYDLKGSKDQPPSERSRDPVKIGTDHCAIMTAKTREHLRCT